MLFMAANSVCTLKAKEIITVMTKSLNGAIEAQKLMDPEILFKLLERIKFEIPTSTEPWSKWKKKVKKKDLQNLENLRMDFCINIYGYFGKMATPVRYDHRERKAFFLYGYD